MAQVGGVAWWCLDWPSPPCLLAPILALYAGPEDAASADGEAGLPDKARALLGALGPAYWQALAVVALLYMARFDAAFATLRARTVRGWGRLGGWLLGLGLGVGAGLESVLGRRWLPA